MSRSRVHAIRGSCELRGIFPQKEKVFRGTVKSRCASILTGDTVMMEVLPSSTDSGTVPTIPQRTCIVWLCPDDKKNKIPGVHGIRGSVNTVSLHSDSPKLITVFESCEAKQGCADIRASREDLFHPDDLSEELMSLIPASGWSKKEVRDRHVHTHTHTHNPLTVLTPRTALTRMCVCVHSYRSTCCRPASSPRDPPGPMSLREHSSWEGGSGGTTHQRKMRRRSAF